jgi:hypothetical protein
MPQFGGKNAKKKTSSSSTKRHFTVVMGNKDQGLYVSSSPSSAARKAVSKLCASNKSKKVEFSIREITQGSKKKTYGPYKGYIEKLKEPIELKGRVIKYKPVAKLSRKTGAKKGGEGSGANGEYTFNDLNGNKSNIFVNNQSVRISNREKKKNAGEKRKQNAKRTAISREESIRSELNRKKLLNEEEAKQNKLRNQQNQEFSRLYRNLLERVNIFYESNKTKPRRINFLYKLENRPHLGYILLYNKFNLYHSIFLTINIKTSDYCAFQITKDKHAIILLTSNNIDEFIKKLAKIPNDYDYIKTLKKLEINQNFCESFPRIYFKTIIEQMEQYRL